MTKAQEKAAAVLANKKVAYSKKVGQLTGHAFGRVSNAAMMAAFDAGTTAEDFAVSVAAQEPVGLAIHPLKAEAVAHAEDDARKTVEKVRVELEAGGWDLNAVAPWPTGSAWAHDYEAKRNKARLFSELTETVGFSRSRGQPHPVKMSDKGIERFVNQAGKDAAFQYDAFICKLVAKVGEVETASINGNHVWGHSVLTVTKADGSVENWKTQQIVNYSKYGRGFYQWPSRKMK